MSNYNMCSFFESHLYSENAVVLTLLRVQPVALFKKHHKSHPMLNMVKMKCTGE